MFACRLIYLALLLLLSSMEIDLSFGSKTSIDIGIRK
jgi:hypothetical protein